MNLCLIKQVAHSEDICVQLQGICCCQQAIDFRPWMIRSGGKHRFSIQPYGQPASKSLWSLLRGRLRGNRASSSTAIQLSQNSILRFRGGKSLTALNYAGVQPYLEHRMNGMLVSASLMMLSLWSQSVMLPSSAKYAPGTIAHGFLLSFCTMPSWSLFCCSVSPSSQSSQPSTKGTSSCLIFFSIRYRVNSLSLMVDVRMPTMSWMLFFAHTLLVVCHCASSLLFHTCNVSASCGIWMYTLLAGISASRARRCQWEYSPCPSQQKPYTRICGLQAEWTGNSTESIMKQIKRKGSLLIYFAK